jgi:hypothetical protein
MGGRLGSNWNYAVVVTVVTAVPRAKLDEKIEQVLAGRR